MSSFEEGGGLFMKPLMRHKANNNTLGPNDIKIQPLNLLFGGSIVVPKIKPNSPRTDPRATNGGSRREEVIFVEVPDRSEPETRHQQHHHHNHHRLKKHSKKKTSHNHDDEEDTNPKGKTKADKPVVCHLKKNKASIDLTDCKKVTPPIKVMCIKNKKCLDDDNKLSKKKVVIISESESEATTSETGDEAASSSPSSSSPPLPPRTKSKAKNNNGKNCDGTCCEGKKKGAAKKAKTADDSSSAAEATTAEGAKTDADGAATTTATEDGVGDDKADSAAQITEDPSIKDKSEGTQTKGSSTAAWTPSQDALIRSMKQGGETWAAIGAAVGAGKKEVAKRWKELGGAGDGALVVVAVTAAAEKNNTNASSSDKKNKKDNKGSSSTEAKATTSPVQPSPPLLPSPPSPSAPSSAPHSVSPLDPPEAEHAAQKTHIYTNVFAVQYPSNLRHHPLVVAAAAGGDSSSSSSFPSPLWTEHDVRVLGTLDSKHKVDRWLTLQADFFNATGRMVSADMLRAKVEEGELTK